MASRLKVTFILMAWVLGIVAALQKRSEFLDLRLDIGPDLAESLNKLEAQGHHPHVFFIGSSHVAPVAMRLSAFTNHDFVFNATARRSNLLEHLATIALLLPFRPRLIVIGIALDDDYFMIPSYSVNTVRHFDLIEADLPQNLTNQVRSISRAGYNFVYRSNLAIEYLQEALIPLMNDLSFWRSQFFGRSAPFQTSSGWLSDPYLDSALRSPISIEGYAPDILQKLKIMAELNETQILFYFSPQRLSISDDDVGIRRQYEEFSALAEKQGFKVIDFRSIREDMRPWMTDSLHLTEQGVERLAHKILLRLAIYQLPGYPCNMRTDGLCGDQRETHVSDPCYLDLQRFCSTHSDESHDLCLWRNYRSLESGCQASVAGGAAPPPCAVEIATFCPGLDFDERRFCLLNRDHDLGVACRDTMSLEKYVCSFDLARFCPGMMQRERAGSCLAKNFGVLEKSCQALLLDQQHGGACYVEKSLLCDTSKPNERKACLRKKMSQLSPGCRDEVNGKFVHDWLDLWTSRLSL